MSVWHISAFPLFLALCWPSPLLGQPASPAQVLLLDGLDSCKNTIQVVRTHLICTDAMTLNLDQTDTGCISCAPTAGSSSISHTAAASTDCPDDDLHLARCAGECPSCASAVHEIFSLFKLSAQLHTKT